MEAFSLPFVAMVVVQEAVNVDRAKEKQIDDAFLERFQCLTKFDPSIHYSELILQNEEETVKARRRKMMQSLQQKASEWSGVDPAPQSYICVW
ncbi:hypothetical protein U1Q18_004361 [Sarracenia purpurea var. burkii]